MSIRYNEASQNINVPSGEIEDIANVYKDITEEGLCEIAINLFRFFLNDEYAAKFRRMFTV